MSNTFLKFIKNFVLYSFFNIKKMLEAGLPPTGGKINSLIIYTRNADLQVYSPLSLKYL